MTLDGTVSNVNELADKTPLTLITPANHCVLCFIFSVQGKHNL